MAQSLPPPALDRHRAEIGITVEAILDGYWKSRPAEVVRQRIMKDWMDELQDWTIAQVEAALIEWRNRNPDKKPNPGHIKLVLMKFRGEAWAYGMHPAFNPKLDSQNATALLAAQ